MRMIPLIAATVLSASSAGAQFISGDCRGETLGDLADCVAASAPPAVEPESAPAGRASLAAPSALQPRSMGGALTPRDLRSAPLIVGAPVRTAQPGDVSSGAPGDTLLPGLYGLTSDPTSPFYGRDGGAAQRERDAMRTVDPLAGTGIGTFGVAPRQYP